MTQKDQADLVLSRKAVFVRCCLNLERRQTGLIKAIFFDLDGTLLDSKKKILASSVRYLKLCSDKGIKLYISTARLPKCRNTLKWGEEVKSLFDGGVFCNGAVIEWNNEYKYKFIPENTVRGILKSLKEYPDIYISVQMKDNVHAFNKDLPEEEKSLWGLEEDKIFSTENCSLVEVIKLLIFDGGYYHGLNKLSDKVIHTISKQCGKDAAFYLTDEGTVIQVNAVSASKYNGIETIRKALGLRKSECAVFGDDYNDAEMLSNYTNSYAMGNAPTEIKNIASFVTDDNDNNGIANALIKILGDTETNEE